MKTKVKQSQPVSHTIQSKTKTANQASVSKVLQQYKDNTAQRAEIEEDELLQGKFETAQREELPEEDELLQGKFETAQREELPEEDELLQGKFETAQREELDEDELLQGKFESMRNEQLGMSNENPEMENITNSSLLTTNLTGLPDNLKSGIEATSGYSMDAVRVHYNSAKPAQLQALAYTQGTDIHVAPGQEKHLPHEAWHVVQQMQGRVQPTMQLQGVNINDNEGLEKEADVMGGKARRKPIQAEALHDIVQRKKCGLCRQDPCVCGTIRKIAKYSPDKGKDHTPQVLGQAASQVGKFKGHASGKAGDGMNDATKEYMKKLTKAIDKEETKAKTKTVMPISTVSSETKHLRHTDAKSAEIKKNKDIEKAKREKKKKEEWLAKQRADKPFFKDSSKKK